MKTLDAALLRALRDSGVHIPAGELASDLVTTMALIREKVAGLREAGFSIDECPGLGYRLTSSPDRLIADDLFARLGAGSFIREIIVFAETDSTNDRAAQLGAHGAAAGVAIFAESQRAGRGRFGRPWISASHLGIWCSLLLRPSLAPAKWTRLTTWAAVSIAVAMEKCAGVSVQIKWPNDLLVDGRKAAGILIETGIDRLQSPFAVLGFGVNVNQTESDFPEELKASAASLRQVCGHPLSRPDLGVRIFSELEERCGFLEDNFDRILVEAGARNALLGKSVAAQFGDLVVEGIADELDEDGHLVLREANGVRRRLSGGEASIFCKDL